MSIFYQQSYKSQSQRAWITLNQLASSIINSNTSLEMVTLLYQYKFRSVNLTLLYQYAFGDDNLILLMKNYMQVTVVFENYNLLLCKPINGAIMI